MSYVNRIEIQGIRSVGPNENDKLSIRFFRPFTLITGENGAGKTTIIEALKYAAAGSQPPGAKVGGWIHHPKVVNKVKTDKKRARATQCGKVLAKIQCEFETTGKSGQAQLVTVARFVEGTVDATHNSMKQKTLDGAIIVKNISGVKISEQASMKIEDMNKTINLYLRIPKPILELVIFCHQEDTMWPFSEGRILKLKFDEIFQSSEFVSVLDQIKSDRKQRTLGTKLTEEIKRCKESNYKQYINHQQEIEKLNGELESCETQIESYTEKLKILDERNCDLTKSVAEYAFLWNQYVVTKKRCDDIKEDLTALEEKKPNIFSEATGFGFQVDRIKQEIKSCSSSDACVNVENAIKELSSEKIDLQKDADSLKNDVVETKNFLRRYQEKNTEIHEACAKVAKTVKFLNCDEFNSDEARNGLIEHIAAQIDELKAIDVKHNDDNNDEIKKLQDNGYFLTSKKTQLEERLQTSKKRVRENEKKISAHKKQLNNMSEKEKHFCQLQEEEKGLNKILANFKSEVVEKNFEVRISENGALKESVIARIEELEKDEISSKLKNDLVQKKKEVESKISEVNTNQFDLSTKLDNLLEDLPISSDGGYPTIDEVSEYQEKLVEQKRRAFKEKESFNKLMLTKSTDLSALNKQFSEVRRQIQKLRNNDLLNSTGTIDEEKTELTDLQNSLEEKNIELSQMGQDNKIFRLFLQKLRQNKSCPLCSNSLADADQFRKVEEHCLHKMEVSKDSDVVEEIECLRSKIEKLQSVISEMELFEKYRAEEEEIQNKIKPLNKSLHETKKVYEKCTREYERIEKLNTSVGSVEPYLTVFLKNQETIGDLSKQLESVKKKLEAVKSVTGYNELVLNIKVAKKKRKDLECEINQLESERRAIEVKQQKIMERRESVLNEIYQLNSSNDDASKIHEAVALLEAEISELKGNMKPIAVEIEQVNAQYEENRSKINSVREQYSIFKTKLADKMEKIRKKENTLKVIISQSNVEFEGVSELKVSEQVDVLEVKLKTKLEGIRDLETTIDKKKEQRSSFEVERNNLTDVLAYVQKKDVYDSAKLSQKEAKEKIKAISSESMEDLKEKQSQAVNDVNSMKLDIARLEAQKVEKIKTLESWKISSKTNELENSLEELKEATVAAVLNKCSIKDLDQLHHTLDCAIMSIHKDKMQRLNHVIAHLWKSTYQGADIECISISADEDGSEKLSATRRRAYNYCVNMRRFDGTILPMRGRASAGQRVLASLIIRLALAQCFTSCGILALDEPTTNLDRRNIGQFVKTLKSLTNNSNCQFIVITHDSEFVQELCGTAGVDKYYQVVEIMVISWPIVFGIVTGAWSLVGFVGPFLVKKDNPSASIYRCCIIMTAVCCWLHWVLCFLCQSNPLSGPILKKDKLKIIQWSWEK